MTTQTRHSMTEPMPGFACYEATDSGATVDEIFAQCNRDMHAGYGLLKSGQTARPIAYPLAAYRQLIASLAAMPRVACVTLRDLCRQPTRDDSVRLAIRHDVDGDIVAALRGAEIEAAFGVPTSYYFLHTAFYYGRFEGPLFRRHACMAHVYRQIQTLGHDVGLHTNGLEIYEDYKVDGAQAIACEIAWMRGSGIDVFGTVGHGSKAVYGAENFEIFKGRAKGKARIKDGLQEPAELCINGKSAWTRVLDESELGLEYEGNDIFWHKKTKVEYGATRTLDGWRWNRRFDRDAPGALAFCSQEAMLADIAQLESGSCVVLTVHPCYYGLRHRSDAGPTLRVNRNTRVVNADLGWHTWSPRSLVAIHEDHDDLRHDRQQFVFANELGMIAPAKPLATRRLHLNRRVLLLDGAGLADPAMAPESTAGSIAELVCNAADEKGAWLTLAHPGMGLARLFGWFLWGLDAFKPTDIVLGIGTRELAWSMPSIWSTLTGLSANHPTGDCLVPTADGAAEQKQRSDGWLVRQRDPKSVQTWPRADFPIFESMMPQALPKIDGVDADAFVRSCIRQFAKRADESGASLRLVMTDDGPAWSNAKLLDAYRDRISSWAAEAEISFVDPSGDYAALTDDGLSVCRPTGGLSVDAHRALGGLLAASICSNCDHNP